MSDNAIYPLTFEPQLRPYLWGGRNLATLFGRDLPPGPVAESWEISAHPEAPTVVLDGHWRGMALPQVHKILGAELVGRRAMGHPCGDRFPLLVKLLDAERDLSVQVHPDDEYACEHEDGDSGKVETWYMLAAEPDTQLIYGLAPDVDRDRFEQAIAEGRVPQTLARLPVQAGDCIHVPAGTVHALTAGTVLVEIQQNSDATYRVYDWGRVGTDGQPRELHIEKALEVIDWEGDAPGIVAPETLSEGDGVRHQRLVSSPQYALEQIDLAAGAVYEGACTGETFEIWGCIVGEVELAWQGEPLALDAIGFVLLPAALGAFRITAREPARLLRSYLGDGAGS